MTRFDYLIIGGGMTADAAAHGIRKEDTRGTIAIVGADSERPYNRPPLSKSLWKGGELDEIWRKTEETKAELILGRSIVRIDAAAKQATDDRDTTYQYGKLLVATGGTPRRLPNSPDGIIYFRTLAHYRRTRELSDDKARFVVIGGGFIGSEVAAAVRMQGRDVTLVVREDGLGARVFPGDLARWLLGYYQEKGVTMRSGANVGRVESSKGKFQVHLDSGAPISADAVVAGLGIEPNVGLAREAGLKVTDGIEVDELLRTNRPEIFAAGDVANFHNPALGKRLRVEHEDNANTMGETAGRNLAGAGRRYDHLPFFYSDLFDLGYEAVGDVTARHQTVADWKEKYQEGVVYYLEAGRVRGVLLWNVWNQVDAARALIAEPGPFRPEQLKGRLPA